MKFNSIILGGGLAGLMCGIRLLEAGKSCTIVSSGYSALHFSSGSFDLLNRLPNGENVDSPEKGWEKLIEIAPNHPYAKLSKDEFITYAAKVPCMLKELGISTFSIDKKNHYRISPIGEQIPTWLTMGNLLTLHERNHFPWKSVAIVNFNGYLDFYARNLSKEFYKIGIESTITLCSFEVLDQLRQSSTEMRSVNIARILEDPSIENELVLELNRVGQGRDAILLPALWGLKDNDLFVRLQEQVDYPIHLIATLPPSIPGIILERELQKRFKSLGGNMLLGDSGVHVERSVDGYSVSTQKLDDYKLKAENVIVATGSFFSRGIHSTVDRIYEPILGLDIDHPSNRKLWYNEEFFAQQPYQGFGIKTDSEFHGIKNGEVIPNIYVIGAGLAGFDPIYEGSGAGVSCLTALAVADRILKK